MVITRPARSAPVPHWAGGRARSTPAPALITGATFALGIGFTAVVAFSRWFPSGYRNAALSSSLDTVDGSIAVLVAYLLFGRFERERMVRDRLVAHGLALLGLAAIVLPAMSGLLGPRAGIAPTSWASALLRVVGALLVVAGALSGEHRLRRRPLTGLGVVVPVVGVVVIAVLARLLDSMRPLARVVATSGAASGALEVIHDPLLIATQVISATAFLVAALAFARRAVVHADGLAASMAPAFALGTFALVHYSLFASAYPDWLSTGDLLRTGCYTLLLLGAAAEIRRYWSGQTRAAVLEDRRRLAREIHDGVVQEITYIRMETRSMQPGLLPVERIVDACDRALDEARDAVHALALEHDEPLVHLLQRAAHDLSRRYVVEVLLELTADPETDQDQRWALVRIVREAITNAVRHGGARAIVVRLTADEEVRVLEICDDGAGFAPDTFDRTAGGYGLISMRERAAALPGRCTVESAPGAGAVVRVTW